MTARLASWWRSARAILERVHERHRLLPLLVGRPGLLRPREGPSFELGHLLDALLWKEIWVDDEYALGRAGRIPDGAWVLDVGAGIGLFSIAVASRSPGCRVLACEPDPRQLPRLRANLGRAGVSARVQVEACAVGPGGRTWLRPHRAPARTRTSPGPVGGSPESVVEVRTLASLLEAVSGPIALLKIDCEGSERAILDGLGAPEWQRIARVAIETHDDLDPGVRDHVTALLERAGFDVVPIREGGDTCVLQASRSGGDAAPAATFGSGDEEDA